MLGIEVFGNNAPNDTVSGSTFIFNLRLPGQYFDNESKLNYNYFRDYNSMLGRYIQSDPIGFSGRTTQYSWIGINTFGYVSGNSLSNSDYFGLDAKDVVLIRFTFFKSLEKMVTEGVRLPGPGNERGNNNNSRALICNKSLDSIFYGIGSNCSPKEKNLQQCEGQSAYLQDILYKNNYKDGWKFELQSGFGHVWLVGVSNNQSDPIIYMDSWKEEYSENFSCPGCSGWGGYHFNSPLPQPYEVRYK